MIGWPKILLKSWVIKVQIFREGHKDLKKSDTCFDNLLSKTQLRIFFPKLLRYHNILALIKVAKSQR